jgi:hypothetical protein
MTSESVAESVAARLEPRKARVVVLLAEGRTVKECAEEVGIDVRTVYRYRQAPDVAAALAEIATRGLAAAEDRLLCGADRMLDVVESIATNESEVTAVRLAAARDWLDRAEMVSERRSKAAGNADDNAPADPGEVLELARRIVAAQEKQGSR